MVELRPKFFQAASPACASSLHCNPSTACTLRTACLTLSEVRTANTENTSSMDFFAECKTEPGLELFLRPLLQPLSLRPNIFHLYSHPFAQIHFLNHTLFNAHSMTLLKYSFASITEKNLASHVLLSFTVNPIIESTSHQSSAARFWCHLCPSKVPRDTAGPWEPRLDALWRFTFHLPIQCIRVPPFNPIRVPPFKTQQLPS